MAARATPPLNMHPLQDEEKQQFAAASLQYNLQHAQLKSMFQSELQAAISGSSKAVESSASPTTQAAAASMGQAADQSQCTGQRKALSQQQSAADVDRAEEAPTSSMAAMALNDVNVQASGPSIPKHAIPLEDQSDFLDRMYKLMMEGQPEHALAKMEEVFKYDIFPHVCTYALTVDATCQLFVSWACLVLSA